MRKITDLIQKWELAASFDGKWYGLFINPFYITRKQLFYAVKAFAGTIDSKASILDVGCGMKPYQKLWQSKNYLGIDVRGGGLNDRAKKVDKYFDGRTIPYPKGMFDVVIATEVFEHVEFPEKLLREIKRVLKPGGKLFLTMPFVWPEHGIPFDFQRYTSFQHKRILSKCGLKVLTVKPTTGAFGTCGQILSDFLYGQIGLIVWKSNLRYGLKFVIARLLTLLICFPIQLTFELLDIIVKRRGITLDFVVIAEK